MQIGEVARLAEAPEGVRRSTADGLAQWRYHGRLVARQLDDAHVVIRVALVWCRLPLAQWTSAA